MKQEFTAWLRAQGAEVLAPTNPYEMARFRARGGVHVVYEGRRGLSANGFADEALTAYMKGKPIGMGITTKPRTPMARFKVAIVERDGDACFFCGKKMAENEMTVEHLVAKAKGGPDHMDNLALAHKACNEGAANLPLMDKIKMHTESRQQQ